MTCEPDFIRAQGLAFLAHRLKRASELILEDASAALRRHGFSSPARAGSTLLLLSENGPMGVTEIAYRLRLSHPLIIKLTGAIAAAGLVRDETDPADQRRRLIALTASGEAEAARLQIFGRALAETYGAMFVEAGADLFAALEGFEAAAEKRSIEERIEENLEEKIA